MPGTPEEDAPAVVTPRCEHRRQRLLKFNHYYGGETEAVWECLNPECKEHLVHRDAP